MITGKGSGTGNYSYHKRNGGKSEVCVSHMPGDINSIRITFRDYDEQDGPIWKLTEPQAEMLWASLSGMAKDLKWEDYK